MQSNPPSERDFLPNKALGKPEPKRADIEMLELWATGLSVFDSEARARRLAATFPALGRFIAELHVSDDDERVTCRQTMGKGHFTLWGSAEDVLAHVASVIAV